MEHVFAWEIHIPGMVRNIVFEFLLVLHLQENKNRSPQFGNSPQCKSSGQQLPAKVEKTELN